MNYLETAKQYTGNDVDRIFFRPMLKGPSAEELGVRILYNMPLPTTVQYWDGQRNLLHKFSENGWVGGKAAKKYQKTIDMHRVKAEMAFSAADYFSLVYEQITASPDVNMEDLTGTQLEQVETTLFKKAVAENIRTTMWIGDNSLSAGYNSFNGFLKILKSHVETEAINYDSYTSTDLEDPAFIIKLFDNLWENSTERLRVMKDEGQLAFFVTSDIYRLYEKYLDSMGVEASFVGTIDGHQTLSYHGIPVVDVKISSYLPATALHQSFCLFTDRRNLVLAVNTADMPGNEVRMWYNPDEMENRQRAVFMAGCEILDENQLYYAYLA